MKYLALIFTTTFLISACCDNDVVDDVLPDCVQALVNEETSQAELLLTIKAQEVDGEPHYWLNTDARHYDGGEYIVNMSCDTMCYLCGECVEPQCLQNYNLEKWQTLWTK